MNPYEKPPSMSVSQSMKTFLYNRETGAFMGRTASSWGKRGVASFRISSMRYGRNYVIAIIGVMMRFNRVSTIANSKSDTCRYCLIFFLQVDTPGIVSAKNAASLNFKASRTFSHSH